ncbi:unnamed protein product [Calicophoron daubneyi]|uniref:Uncharacterized protein n=1 Tax=Calicophoron daubneyi TaxID=300641 RepID=A0AAV2TSF9_CALDB
MIEEEIEDRPPPISLYCALEEKGRFMGRTNMLYSSVLVGKISPHVTDRQSVTAYFDTLMTQFKEPDEVTGLLMVYPYHVLTIIETSFRTLMKIIRALNESEKIINCYIAAYTEQLNKDATDDEEKRSFNSLDSISVQELFDKHTPAPVINNKLLCVRENLVQRIFRTESDEKKLIETLGQLARLSAFLAEEPMKNMEEYVPEIFKMRITQVLSKLREEHPDLVPPQTTVGYFSEVSTYEGLIPLEEYLNFYDLPYEVSLQSETTWPIQKKKFFYY